MPVDWVAVSEAIRLGTTGRATEGLQLLMSHEATCESDRDRAAICNGKAMCYAHLGNFSEALAQIKTAKLLAGTERDLMLQIELAEAATRVLSSDYQIACALYEHIAVTYSDVLAEDHDSAQEFQERFGYALFYCERYRDAVRVFQRLLTSKSTQDEQRIRLFLGAALAMSGDLRDGRRELELAAKGPDPKLSQDALNWLTSAHDVQ